MTNINFPISPNVNDEYTFNGKTWMWNGTGWVILDTTNQDADTIIIPDGLGTPTYDDLQDFLNMTRSAGTMTGGEITAHDAGNDALLNISEHEGYIFTNTTLGSTLIPFKKAAQDGVSPTGITDGAVNYVYIDYDGGSLTYKATVTRADINNYSMFQIGRIWIDGNDIEIQPTGHFLYNKDRRTHDRLISRYGNMDRVSGSVLSKHATALRLTCSAGSWYVANYPFGTDAADTFYVYYKSGSAVWNKSAEMTLFSDIFNGAAAKTYETYQNGTALTALTNYGVFWVFQCPEGELYIVLGTANYPNVGAAQAATVPAALPPYLVNWGRLIGRVICIKSGVALYTVESVWATTFTLSAAVDHASLYNLAMADSGHPAATAAINGYATAAQITKLDGIEAGAEVNNISDANATALTDSGETALHSHAGGGGGDKYAMEFRLTLETNVPVSLTDQLAKTQLYITPYRGNQIGLSDNAGAWTTYTSAEFSISLAGLGTQHAFTNDPAAGSNIELDMNDTSGFLVGEIVKVSSSAGSENATITVVHDDTHITVDTLALNHTTTTPLVIGRLLYNVFVYDDEDMPTAELEAWTNNTTPATAVILQDGVKVKSGDITRRFIGAISTTLTIGQCEDSLGNRLVSNYYNRVRRPFGIREAGNTNSWPYNGTSLVWRPANNDVANRVNLVVGVAEDEISARVVGIASHSVAASYAIFGIGINSTTSNSSGSIIGGVTYLGAGAAGTIFPTYGSVEFIPSVGFTYLQWVESSQSDGTGTFYGWPAQPNDLRQSGISGSLMA